MVDHPAVKTFRTISLGRQKSAGKKPLTFKAAEIIGKTELKQSVPNIQKAVSGHFFPGNKLIPLKL
jgi:hypothetical protein